MSTTSPGDRVELLRDWPRVRLKAGAAGTVTAVNRSSVTILWDAHDGDGIGYAEGGGGYPDWHMGVSVVPIAAHREGTEERSDG